MATRSIVDLLASLRKFVGNDQTVRDGELLERFRQTQDHAAFEELMHRHGAMVWRLCRRVLGEDAAVEDAYQAVFIVLLEKAGSIRVGDSLASWLYRIALRTSVNARTATARRRRHEQQSTPREATMTDAELQDLSPLIDEELARLPEKYRAPLILCLLQGKTTEQAAGELGWPTGSMSYRIARGKELLRQRLHARGVAMSAVGLALFSSREASARVPAVLHCSTMEAIKVLISNPAAAVVRESALTLAQGVINAMFWRKTALIASVFIAIVVLGTGTGLAIRALGNDAPDVGLSHKDAPPDGESLPEGATARLGSLKFASARGSYRAQFTDDGKTLVLFKQFGAIHFIDLKTGKETKRWNPRLPATHLGTLSPRGNILTLASEHTVDVSDIVDNVVVFEWKTGAKQRRELGGGVFPDGRDQELRAVGPITALALDSLGRDLVVCQGPATAPGGNAGGTVRFWRLGTNTLSWSINTEGNAKATFVNDSRTLICSDCSAIYIIETASGRRRATLATHAADLPGPAAFAVTRDGKHIAYVHGGQLVFRRLDSDKPIWAIKASPETRETLAFNSDDSEVACAGAGGQIQVFDAASGNCVRTLHAENCRRLDAICIRPDGKAVAATGVSAIDGNWNTWLLDNDNSSLIPDETHAPVPNLLAFSPDGKSLSCGSSGMDATNHLRIWDLATGKRLYKLDEASQGISCVAYAEDSKNIVVYQSLTGGKLDAKPFRVLDAATGNIKTSFGDRPTMKSPVAGQAGKCVYCWNRLNAKLQLYDWRGREVGSYEVPREADYACMSPDGTHYGVITRRPAKRVSWSLFTRKIGEDESREIEDVGKVDKVVFSPDNKTVAALGTNSISVYDVETGNCLIHESTNFVCAAFSPNGEHIAVGGIGIHVYDLATGEVVKSLPRPHHTVRSLAYSADGKRMASSSDDRTILIWNMD